MVLRLVCQTKHIINVLICLEFVLILLFFGFVAVVTSAEDSQYLIFFLVIGCALTSAGLAIIISYVRSPGRDSPRFLRIIMC